MKLKIASPKTFTASCDPTPRPNSLSFGSGAFALLVVLFFYRRRNKQVEQIGKIGGVIASAVAVIKYDQIIAIFERVFGSGADWMTIATLAVASLVLLAVMLGPA